MSQASETRDLLLHELQTRLLPWAREGGAHLSLAEPPIPPSESFGARQLTVRALEPPAEKKSYLNSQHWPDHTLVAKPFPYLGVVLEGTAELRCTTPVPSVPERVAKPRRQKSTVHVLTLPPQNFLVIPAHVPHSDGKVPHWEGSRPGEAFSRIFWILVLPAGILVHICTTDGHEHSSVCPLFLHDSHLSAAAELLVEELRTRRPQFELAALAQLQFILLRTERGLLSQEPLATGKGIRLFPADSSPSLASVTNPTLELACRYIQTHLEDPLTPAQIAHHAHVSPTHLNRLFRAELGLSVMGFVSSCRLEMARSMLENTDLPMSTVSRLTGYYDAAHLAHAFTRTIGLSPTAYRSNFRHVNRRLVA